MLLATWPAAVWFKEPRMLWIVPFVTLNTFVHSFISSRVFTCARHVNVAPLLKLELVTQVIALGVNIVGAYYGYGVLSLLVGQFVGSVIYTAASHLLPVNDHKDRWNMDPVLRKEILGFGRWIFFSSALTVVAGRGDSAMLGRLLGPASLGLYNLAANIADLPESLGSRLMNSVIYPTLSSTFKDAPENFSRMFYRLRFYFDGVAHTALGLLAAMSEWIIAFLYPDRYQGAGAMLSVFAFRTSIGLLAAPWESAFFARGHTHFGFRRSLITSIAVLVGMPLGYHWFGGVGVLWATVVARGTALLVLWPAAHVEGLIRYHRELLAPLFLVLGLALGSLLASGLTAWLPGVTVTSILQSFYQR
jgi:O-antigen/teichoic acid export membrane protein